VIGRQDAQRVAQRRSLRGAGVFGPRDQRDRWLCSRDRARDAAPAEAIAAFVDDDPVEPCLEALRIAACWAG